MARPLRLQFPDAWYYVASRGRRTDKTFKEIPESRRLAVDVERIKKGVCRFYEVSESDLHVTKKVLTMN